MSAAPAVIEQQERVVTRWFDSEESAGGVARALDALRRYGRAEAAMVARVSATLGLRDTDLSAVDLLIRAKMRDEPVNPATLKEQLEISMAGVTVMLDRLERAGYIVRETDPHDSRRRLISTTERADTEVVAHLQAARRHVASALTGLGDEQLDTVTDFLGLARTAVDEVMPTAD